MPSLETNLIWIDLEMTGLIPERDHIIEIATVITDDQLNLLAEGPVMALNQPESILAGMDDWNMNQHTRSGLLQRVRSSEYTEAYAEKLTLEFLRKYVAAGSLPCAATVSARTAVSSAGTCPGLRNIFITVTWT